MKKNYLKLLLGCAFFSSAQAQAQTTYSYTGATDTYIVPAGISLISIESNGSKGLDGAPALGGNGATMYGEFTVSPGDLLTFYVGGNSAGIKSGGDGSWVENTTSGTLLIIAGGGGGGTHGQVGAGAPVTNSGTASISHPGYTDGAPGVAGNGGGAGIGAWGTGGGGGWLSAGTSGAGSPGGAMTCKASYGTTYAGGAGGGYSGGGGVDMDSGWGTGGGGAGGSYNIGANQVNIAANNAALGEITINELCSVITFTLTAETICIGESFTLEGAGTGTITWDGGVINGVAYTPAAAGIFTYTASSDSDGDCGFSIDIEVVELPTVTANVDDAEICIGETIILSGGGAITYTWFPLEIVDGVAYAPGVGTYTYSVIGTDSAGCENFAEVAVTIYALPEVEATATDEEICLGESVTLNGAGAATYVWTPGEMDGIAFTPDATGTTMYDVNGIDVNGCENNASINITVYDVLEITFTTTDEIAGSDGAIDITVTGGNPAYLVDWDNDGTGDFDDTEDLTGLTAGVYEVVVMCDAGCTATASVTVNGQVSINEIDGLQVSVYPNPTLGSVNVQFAGIFTYELTSISGDLILQGQAVDKAEFTLENLANGIYVVSIKADGKTTTVKVIKK